MELTPAPGFPFESLADAVALLGPDGELTPRNEPMRRLLAALAPPAAGITRLDQLPLLPDQFQDLAAGLPVRCAAAGSVHELRLSRTNGAGWLLAIDRTAEHRAAALALASARARALADCAGTVVHDLANLLGAGLALADWPPGAPLDPADARVLEELKRGTRQGVLLARAVQRLLARDPRQRERLPVARFLDEALAVVGKSAERRAVALVVAMPADLPGVWVVAAEASQALLHGLAWSLAAPAVTIDVDVAPVVESLAGGRARNCVRVRVVARNAPAASIDEALRALAAETGWLAALAEMTTASAALPMARLAMRCVGGDLRAARTGDGLSFDYVWPAASPAGA